MRLQSLNHERLKPILAQSDATNLLQSVIALEHDARPGVGDLRQALCSRRFDMSLIQASEGFLS